MIKIAEIHKSFGKLQVLKGITANFDASRITAVIGHNGSGKTTLIKCILGMVIPDSGEIDVYGENIARQFHYRSKIGYMPQIGRYPDNMTIGQVFSMMRDIRGNSTDKTDEELLDKYQLSEMFEKKMRMLSGGTRQKVSAALAFLFAPPILILDEPTAGLDPVASEILKEKILKEKQNGKSIIITSHIMPEVEELADDVLFMYEGKVKFHRSVLEMKQETGEQRIGKALARMLGHS